MDLIADILLAAGALGAGFYCLVLGRRLNKFNNLEKGVGGAVAVLSAQVDDLKKTLESAQKTAAASAETLSDLNLRAEEISKRLELQIASLHDLPVGPEDTAVSAAATPAPEPAEAAPEPSAAPEPKPANSPMFTRRAAGGR